MYLLTYVHEPDMETSIIDDSSDFCSVMRCDNWYISLSRSVLNNEKESTIEN